MKWRLDAPPRAGHRPKPEPSAAFSEFMKSIVLRLTLASALALSGLTACTKKPESTELKPDKKKIKKDGTNLKEKKKEKKEKKAGKTPKDPVAPATPAPPAP